MMLAQITAFLGAIALSAFLTVYVRDFARARGWMDLPVGGRHLHLLPVPRLGGVAIFLSFVAVTGISLLASRTLASPALISPSGFYPILGPATLIFIVGLYDDIFGGSPYQKFTVQAIAAIWLYVGGIGIHRLDMLVEGEMLRTLIGLPLTIFWVLLITNAFNLIDGLDGLSVGSALFTTMVLCIQSLLSDNFSIAFLAVVLAGAILGFLRHNFHPATIFLGDCGSLFIGFLISALALAGSQKSTIMLAVAIPVISCGLPILDVGIAVLRRYMNDKPLFGADQDHVHHRLLKRGVSQRNAVLILYAVSAGFAMLSLALFHGGITVTMVVSLAGIGTYLGLRHLRYEEFVELHRLVQQIFRQKRIIKNNLSVRRAAQSLQTGEGTSEIFQLLAETLRPLGFSRFVLKLAPPGTLPEPLPATLIRIGEGEVLCNLTVSAPSTQEWELKLALTTETCDNIGTLTVLRPYDAGILLLDINVFTTLFNGALGEALQRLSHRIQYATKD
ncbi:MAG: undecaprenyl/decaprenyl-phosphate alpha-N-acetylglucosaminyl 1-phosphate transferase [Acidobacteria bacterium]|nr:undecaprenyl/decaprenyl-phosphate alpha-N-acetylglucosaminyl 1-phosphate transferase [Acidobacteriota bacterium]